MKTISNSLIFIVLSIALMTLSSCGNDEPESSLTNDEQIQEYLTANGINAQRTASGLYYVIENPGGDEKPVSTSVVLVDYRGYLLNGDEFDSSISRGQPAQFSLERVIPGWTEGIALFGREGKGSLYIPSQLAYGRQGSGSIGPNTPIAFDITLYDFR